MVSSRSGTSGLDGLAAMIDPSVFVNFETWTVSNGAAIDVIPAGASTISAPDGVFVTTGSTLRLGDLDDILGSLTIDATSEVLAFGDSPGLNMIMGDLNLAGLYSQVDGDPDDRTDVTGNLNGTGGTIAQDVTFGPAGPVMADLITFGGDLNGTAGFLVNIVPTMDMPMGAAPLLT